MARKSKKVLQKVKEEAQQILDQIPSKVSDKEIYKEVPVELPSKDMMKIDHAQLLPTQNNFSSIDYPVFLMNMPLSLSNIVPNNAWVTGEVTGEKAKPVSVGKAVSEFIDMYSVLTQFAVVYLLPTTGNFQDLYYVANIGVALEPTETGIPFILSNFRSTPRVNEDVIGRQFLSSMNFICHQSPHFFEGKADCLRLKKNIYISGYGIRTDIKTHHWLMDNFGVEVISIKMTEPALYHTDCNVFVVNEDNVIACTSLLEKKDLKTLEKHANVIPISIDDAFSGSCNSIQTGNGAILNASLLSSLDPKSDYYAEEVKRTNRLNKIISELGYELIMLDLGEATKSGALASCCVCHLNYFGFESKF